MPYRDDGGTWAILAASQRPKSGVLSLPLPRVPLRDRNVERLVCPRGTLDRMTDERLDADRTCTDAALELERRLRAERLDRDHRMVDALLVTNARLAAERSDADQAVVRATEGRDDVLAMISHDLRSPLAVIRLNAELIGEQSSDPSVLEMIEDTILASGRMERMLDDLLDVARVDAGKLRIVKRRQDVRTLVGEMAHGYQPLFDARDIRFDVEMADDELVASIDAGRIVQVLANLLGNAMKFTPPTRAVTLRVARRAGALELALSDEGPGIRPDALTQIFERYSQVTTSERRGLGLGLFICEKIVEAHGGKIWAESEVGHGTTIRFTVPA